MQNFSDFDKVMCVVKLLKLFVKVRTFLVSDYLIYEVNERVRCCGLLSCVCLNTALDLISTRVTI